MTEFKHQVYSYLNTVTSTEHAKLNSFKMCILYFSYRIYMLIYIMQIRLKLDEESKSDSNQHIFIK